MPPGNSSHWSARSARFPLKHAFVFSIIPCMPFLHLNTALCFAPSFFASASLFSSPSTAIISENPAHFNAAIAKSPSVPHPTTAILVYFSGYKVYRLRSTEAAAREACRKRSRESISNPFICRMRISSLRRYMRHTIRTAAPLFCVPHILPLSH